MLLNSRKSVIYIQNFFSIILCIAFEIVFANKVNCFGQKCQDSRVSGTAFNNEKSLQSFSLESFRSQSLNSQPINLQSLNSQSFSSRRDLLKKEIRREALQNGKSGSGFVHFPLVHKYSGLPGSSYRGGLKNESLYGIMSRKHHELLQKHDRKRHGRRLASVGGGANFDLGGNTDPQVAGLYWATIGLGTPSTFFKVQIDSGSDVLWVQCQPCQACAFSSELVKLAAPFAPSKSSTSSVVSCTDSYCTEFQSVQSDLGVGCSTDGENDDRCYYRLRYGDGSATTGYAITDKMQYTSLAGTNAESSISFGCSYNQSGQLILGNQSVDGLLGLGSGPWSIITQLTEEGVIANSFAHCLGGEEYGQGSLILGSVVMDTAVYTPMSDSGHYYVTLEGISVDSVRLGSVTEDSFGTKSDGRGVILDSGTTLALVPDDVWSAVASQVVSRVSAVEQMPFSATYNQYCWDYTDKKVEDLTSIFPNMTLHFTSGADMQLNAYNYMVILEYGNNELAACYVWQPGSSTDIDITVLGDVVMRDKLIIYDLERNEIGWSTMDCTNGVIKTQNASIIFSRVSGAKMLKPRFFWVFLLLIGLFSFLSTIW